MSTIGLDIGTTGCKALVVNTEGQILGQASREYGITAPQPGWTEQNAEQVWTLAWAALRQAIAPARHDPPVALAISCQGEAVIPVDESGIALRLSLIHI